MKKGADAPFSYEFAIASVFHYLCCSHLFLANELTNQWPEQQYQSQCCDRTYQVVREENI